MKGAIGLTTLQLDVLEVQVVLRKGIVERQIKRLEEGVNQHSSFTSETHMMQVSLEMLKVELEVLEEHLKAMEED
jgi:hypothetical protein